MNKWLFSLIMALFVLFMTPINAQYTVLYEFQDGRGGSSLGHLVVDGTVMYGMQPGGDHDLGAIFKIDIDGTDYTPLHHFTGSSTDGANPSSASLVLDGTTLYGTAQAGGTPGGGVIFKINTDGSGYSNIYNFGYSPDGAYPEGTMSLIGNTLYGTTANGGIDFKGTIFKINTDGTGYSRLHEFTGGTSEDGRYPFTGFANDGSFLYGITTSGGSNFNGTIYKIQPDGTGYAKIYDFGAYPAPYSPSCHLILDGTTLYGTYWRGGANLFGGIFKIQTDGSGFTTIHDFTGGATGGAFPMGGVNMVGDILYGTAADDVTYDGVLYKINKNGTGFEVLHRFEGGDNDVANPGESVSISNGVIYGMASEGGNYINQSSPGSGGIYSYLLGQSPVIEVDFDIHPTSWPNPLNVKSRGVVPTAILGTESFDVQSIDPTSITLEGVSPIRWSYEDVTGPAGTGECNETEEGPDGFLDLTLKFDTQELVAALGTVNNGDIIILSIVGYLSGGEEIVGDDCIIIKAGNNKEEIGDSDQQDGLELLSNNPNPFNPETYINYKLNAETNVLIEIYDITGKHISTLFNDHQSEGTHSVKWTGKNDTGANVPAGIYIVKVTAEDIVRTDRLMLLK